MPDTNGNGTVRVFTPTELRLLAVLADGDPHDKGQLMEVIEDGLASPSALRFHICNLKKKLRPRNETVHCVCLSPRKYAYVHVRRLVPVE